MRSLAGLIIHKRVGKGAPLDQWVHMTVRELVAILAGHRDNGGPRELDDKDINR